MEEREELMSMMSESMREEVSAQSKRERGCQISLRAEMFSELISEKASWFMKILASKKASIDTNK